MKNFFRKLIANPQTTVAGIATLAFVGMQAYQNPGVLANPQTIGLITSGIGLIVANDHQTPPPVAPAH